MNLPVPPTPFFAFLGDHNICSLCLCLFQFVNKIVYTFTNIFRFHLFALIYDICFSLSYLLMHDQL